MERAEDMQRRFDEFRTAVYEELGVEDYDDIEGDEDTQRLCELLLKASDELEGLRKFYYDSDFV